MGEKAAEVQQDVKAGADRIRVAKELLRTLTKAAKAFKLYSESHHLVTKFLDEMEQAIVAALKVCGTLSLEVTDTSFLLGEDVVFEQKGQDGNYAFRLYKDGIRRLIFKKKPSQQELRTFIDILGKTPMMLSMSHDDMVTMLWKAELESISYRAIDGFAEMMLGDPDFKKEYNETVCDILPGFNDVLSEQEEGWGAEMVQGLAPQGKLEVGNPEVLQSRMAELVRSHPAQHRLHDQMSAEEHPDGLFRHMATVLLRCMLTPACPLGAQEQIGHTVNLLQAMAQGKALGAYLTTTSTMEILARHPQLLPGELPVVVKRVLREAAGDERMFEMLLLLQQEEEKTLVRLGQFFLRNTHVPVQKLQELLEHELPWGGGVLARSLMLGAGKDEFDTWLAWVGGDDEEKAVEGLGCIAEQVEAERSIPVLRRSLRHELPLVRLEAGKRLIELDKESYAEAALKLLEDPDPAVRRGMLPLLESFEMNQLAGPLLQRVRSKEFRALEEAERIVWIAALARPGDDRFLAVLAQLMEFSDQKGLKGLFNKKALELNPTRQAVLDALFTIGSAQARKLVEQAREEGDAGIRTYCQSFELAQRHKQLKKGEGEGGTKKEERRSTTSSAGEVQLRLTPVPEPDPAVFKDLLIPLGELIPLAPEDARYTSLDQVPDRLAGEETDDSVSALGRRPLLEGLRPGAALQEVALTLEAGPSAAEAWSLEPQLVLLLLPPAGLTFAGPDDLQGRTATVPPQQLADRVSTVPARPPTSPPPISAGGDRRPTAPPGRPVTPEERRLPSPPPASLARAAAQQPVVPLARPVAEGRTPTRDAWAAAVPEPPPAPAGSEPAAGSPSELQRPPTAQQRTPSQIDRQVRAPTQPDTAEEPGEPGRPRAAMSPARAAAIETLLRKYLRELQERQLMPAPAISYTTLRAQATPPSTAPEEDER